MQRTIQRSTLKEARYCNVWHTNQRPMQKRMERLAQKEFDMHGDGSQPNLCGEEADGNVAIGHKQPFPYLPNTWPLSKRYGHRRQNFGRAFHL
jgi:hypothetical protein